MYAAQDIGVTSVHGESKPLLLCSPGKSSIRRQEAWSFDHRVWSVSVRAQGSTCVGELTKPTAIELANPFKTGLTCLSSTKGEAKLR